MPGPLHSLLNLAFPAGEDLRERQFRFVVLEWDGTVRLAREREPILGVLQNKPNRGEVAFVCVFGVTKVVAGQPVAPGTLVWSDSEGRARWEGPVPPPLYYAGTCLERALHAGEKVLLLLDRPGCPG